MLFFLSFFNIFFFSKNNKGSENVKRSEVHHGEMHEHYGHILGNQMREAVYINLGLLALKKCIDALNRGHSYVPYQVRKRKREG
jgi:hypothetical protein